MKELNKKNKKKNLKQKTKNAAKLKKLLSEKKTLNDIKFFKDNMSVEKQELVLKQVKEIMTKKVITLSAKDNFEKGLDIMTKNRIRHMPIIDGKKLIGMVSQGDLVKEMIAYQKDLIAELEVFVYERAW